MGTRPDGWLGSADFWKHTDGPDGWLGSIAWDGYPEGTPECVLDAGSEDDFQDKVAALIQEDGSGTVPSDGWPWPWDTSTTTDYAYVWTEHGVRVYCFGCGWGEGEEVPEVLWPDMTDIKNVDFGRRSGLIILGTP